ncbi:unnamed protein product, partial [Sphacelaria rigidula]
MQRPQLPSFSPSGASPKSVGVGDQSSRHNISTGGTPTMMAVAPVPAAPAVAGPGNTGAITSIESPRSTGPSVAQAPLPTVMTAESAGAGVTDGNSSGISDSVSINNKQAASVVGALGAATGAMLAGAVAAGVVAPGQQGHGASSSNSIFPLSPDAGDTYINVGDDNTNTNSTTTTTTHDNNAAAATTTTSNNVLVNTDTNTNSATTSMTTNMAANTNTPAINTNTNNITNRTDRQVLTVGGGAIAATTPAVAAPAIT